MKRMRRLSGAAMMAGLIASGMLLGTARVEAAGKKGSDDGQAAVCVYLASVINYPNVNEYVKLWAMSLYNSMGCSPALP